MPRSTTLNQLAQILLPAKYTDNQLQRALDSTGHDDVQRAAEILLLGIGSSKVTDLDGWLRPSSGNEGDERKKKRKRKLLKRDDEDELGKQKIRSISEGQTEPIVLSSSEDEPQLISHTKPIQPQPQPSTPELNPDYKPQLNPIPTSPTRILSLGTLLQAPSPARRNIARPPLTLTTPSSISSHLPCSVVPSPLNPAFASSLYLSLLDAAKTEEIKDGDRVVRKGFTRHEWYLNGKLVVSPHTSGYYRLTEEQGGVKDGGEYCGFDRFVRGN
jgi:hypothetical protein